MSPDPIDSDRAVLDALAAVRAAKPVLERLARGIDGRFAALGDITESLGAARCCVGERSSRLAAVVRDKEGLVLAFQFFKKARDVVEANLEQIRSADAELLAAELALRRFRSGEETFARYLTIFWYLSTATRVEAGWLSGKQRLAILTLADMLAELHAELTEMVRDHFTDLTKVMQSIAGVRQKLGAVQSRCRERMEQSIRNVMETFEALDKALDRARAYESEHERQEAKAGACFERIVVALQSQDIVRQKLESVARGFTTILDERPTGQHLALINALAQIEQRQVSDAEQEILSAEATVMSGIGEFMSCCEQALALNLEVKTDVRNSLARSATTARLLDCLNDLEQVVGATSGIAGEVSTVIQAVRVRVMTHMDALSNALHALRLIALNAQVRAAKVSSQTALETLAAKTKETSEEMRQSSSDLLGAIRTVVARLETLEAGLKDIGELSAREQESLKCEGASVQVGIKNIETSLNESFGALEASLSELRSRVAESTGALRPEDEVTQPFAQVAQACAALARATALVGRDSAHTSYVKRRLDELRTGYHVSDQRIAHDESVTSLMDRKNAPNGLEKGSGQPPTPDSAAGKPAQNAATAGTETTAQSNQDTGLGDNIELF